ncbi:COQ9 family protein [Aliiroseovarius subalbicans]|uniref:COQ9 family protein n=1 Tax=Aliiroseovarius subalbicans TaxID=2925840 RepID=UPI001F5A2C50|nr:COQ9 family protein [Aliiroseovarius subalbicans]MCI2399772.1 COQ9 family protein [Aliiroseovarius subalbicans]
MDDAKRLLNAVLTHVPFDGWTQAAMDAGAGDCGLSPDQARALYPRGPVDLALAFHRRGDAEMVEKLHAANLDDMRFRDRIAAGVRFRLEGADKELVRRGMTLFALPQNVGDGTGALWGTCGAIWEALGDTSDDVNWYTKRATLSGVYSSTLLYWLGDDSEGHAATWSFLDRRINDVMTFEKVKAKARDSKLVQAFMAGPGKILDGIKAPGAPRENYPGHWGQNQTGGDTE